MAPVCAGEVSAKSNTNGTEMFEAMVPGSARFGTVPGYMTCSPTVNSHDQSDDSSE